jgi:hypothetical protein
MLVEAMTKAGKNSYAYRWDEPNPTENDSLAQHAAENWWMFRGVNTGYDIFTTLCFSQL